MAGSSSQSGPADNRLAVSRAKDAVLVQVFGLGNMFLAPTLQTFVESELRSGFTSFIIDLKNCQGMDSTFMGTFIGLTRQVKAHLGWFCLVNVSDENRRLLKMLGVVHMVPILDEALPEPQGQSIQLYPTNDSLARTKQIHSAHRLLIEADPENAVRFGPFVEAMEKELAQREGGPGPTLPTILPPDQDDPAGGQRH